MFHYFVIILLVTLIFIYLAYFQIALILHMLPPFCHKIFRNSVKLEFLCGKKIFKPSHGIHTRKWQDADLAVAMIVVPCGTSTSFQFSSYTPEFMSINVQLLRWCWPVGREFVTSLWLLVSGSNWCTSWKCAGTHI